MPRKASTGAAVSPGAAGTAPPRSDIDRVRRYFHNFAEYQAPENGSPLYQVLSRGVLNDPDMLRFAASCPPSQPSANLLFAAVHELLLAGAQHPLRDYYPDVLADEKPVRAPGPETYAVFQDFVWSRQEIIRPVLETRLVQTNVVRRTTCLLPLFAEVAQRAAGRPLALIEIGTSAGLNLHWDRYYHRYDLPSGAYHSWGDVGSPVHLTTQVRGDTPLPAMPPAIRVVWRRGIDLNPIDVNDVAAMRWIRALIFPEHIERHHTLEAAARVARAHPVPVLKGDALEQLPALLKEVPSASQLCVYATMVLNQFSADGRQALHDLLSACSRARPVALLTMGGVREGWGRLHLTDFADGRISRRHLADCHAHGRWLEWQAAADE